MAFAFQIIPTFPSSAWFNPCNHSTAAEAGVLTCSLRPDSENSILHLLPSLGASKCLTSSWNYRVDKKKGRVPKSSSPLVAMNLWSDQDSLRPTEESWLLLNCVSPAGAGGLRGKCCFRQAHLDKMKQILYHRLYFFFLFSYFYFFIHLYCSIIALQCCVSFCFTTKWISSMYTKYIPISPPSWASLPPSLSHPSRWSQSTELISLRCAFLPQVRNRLNHWDQV